MATWLDKLFLNYRTVRSLGMDLPGRGATNYVGDGVTVSDDPLNDQTIVNITGGSGGSGDGSISVLTYRPGGFPATGVYPTWVELVNAAFDVKGAKEIVIDAEGAGGDCHVPAGSWDLGPLTMFSGSLTDLFNEIGLVFDQGATLVTPVLDLQGLYIRNDSTGPVCEISSDYIFNATFSSLATGPGAAPYIAATGTARPFIYGTTISLRTGPFFTAENADIQVSLSNFSAAEDNSCQVDAPHEVLFFVDSSSGASSTQAASAQVSPPAIANTSYDDSINPPLGATTGQEAIDALKVKTGDIYRPMWPLLSQGQVFLFPGVIGIGQATLVRVASNPSNGNTFVINDGTTVETFTFRTSASAAFDVQIGATAADTQENLAGAISSDSSNYSASTSTSYISYFPGSTKQLGIIRVTDTSDHVARLYGTLTTATAIKVYNFQAGPLLGYAVEAGSSGNLPSSDPGVKTFGDSRTQAELQSHEIHYLIEQHGLISWNPDSLTWEHFQASTITYDDSLYAPQLQVGSIQTAVDRLKINVDFETFTQAMADANQSISELNSRKKLLILTGANTAVRTVTLGVPPNKGEVWFVRVNCTGFGVQIKFSTGTATATIAPGALAFVYGDGTNAQVF